MSKIDEIRKRHEEVEGDIEHFRSVPTKGLGDGMKPDMRGVEAHQDRAMLLAALDGEWQSERPAEGLWLVSVHPDQRGKWLRSVNKWPIDAAIWAGNISIHGLTFRIDDEINQLLSGALWQRRTVPRDPFAKEANHE